MEKATRIRLLDAGLALLGTIGAGSTSTRAVEVEAKAPHGSIRHHFGGRKGFYAALADHLYDSDRPRPGESMAQLVQRLVGPDRAVTLARYELTLLATCDSDLQSSMIAGRDRFVDELVAGGVDRADAGWSSQHSTGSYSTSCCAAWAPTTRPATRARWSSGSPSAIASLNGNAWTRPAAPWSTRAWRSSVRRRIPVPHTMRWPGPARGRLPRPRSPTSRAD